MSKTADNVSFASRVQGELQSRGLYHHNIDGWAGPETRKAFDAFLLSLGPVNPLPAADPARAVTSFDVAKRYIGTREVPGKEHNPFIVRWSRAILSWVSTDEVAWCSSFANHCAAEAGYERSGSLAARSWLSTGVPTHLDHARPGDVVILWRVSPSSWEGHVAFLDHYNKSRGLLYLLGGNQNNAVNITAYPVSQLLGIRRLRPLDQLQGTSNKI